MAFWTRLSQSKVKSLVSLQSKARLLGTPNNGSPLIYASKTLGTCLGENPIGGFIGKPSPFSNNVRFFAASAQAEKGAILNEKIQFPIVRLVIDDGRHFMLSTHEALEQAKRLDLDLVLVQSDADPPVCKIFDYRKERFKKKAMVKERNKSKEKLQSDIKEVRFSSKTEQRDLKMKAATIKRLMEDGYRVKCVAMPSKNQRRSGDGEDEEGKKLEALFASLIEMIADEAIVECEPVVKNGQAHIIVRHMKFGPSKKSGAKKSKDVEEDTPEDGTFSGGGDQQVGSLEDGWRRQQSRPIQPEHPHAADNRYRIESRNQFSRVNENYLGLQPQFPAQREQYPSNRNHLMDSSTSGGFNQPPPNRYAPQPPSEARVHPPPPPNRPFKPNPLPPPFPPQGSSSPSPVYGVVSPPSASIPGAQGVAVESNRYARKPNVPSFSPPSGSIPGGQGVAAESNRYARRPNVPSSNPDGRRPGPDHDDQGAFGRFGRDGPRFNQSTVPKSG